MKQLVFTELKKSNERKIADSPERLIFSWSCMKLAADATVLLVLIAEIVGGECTLEWLLVLS